MCPVGGDVSEKPRLYSYHRPNYLEPNMEEKERALERRDRELRDPGALD